MNRIELLPAFKGLTPPLESKLIKRIRREDSSNDFFFPKYINLNIILKKQTRT